MTSIPEISARGSLILWAKFQILVGPRPCAGPRSGREGEKCRPLDHIRQIPYVNPALFTSYNGINFCIYARDFHSFHPYGNYIASWYDVDLSFTHALPQKYSGTAFWRAWRMKVLKVWIWNWIVWTYIECCIEIECQCRETEQTLQKDSNRRLLNDARRVVVLEE